MGILMAFFPTHLNLHHLLAHTDSESGEFHSPHQCERGPHRAPGYYRGDESVACFKGLFWGWGCSFTGFVYESKKNTWASIESSWGRSTDACGCYWVGSSILSPAGVFSRLPQVIVLGAMDLSIREEDTTGESIFHVKGNESSGFSSFKFSAEAFFFSGPTPSPAPQKKKHLKRLGKDFPKEGIGGWPFGFDHFAHRCEDLQVLVVGNCHLELPSFICPSVAWMDSTRWASRMFSEHPKCETLRQSSDIGSEHVRHQLQTSSINITSKTSQHNTVKKGSLVVWQHCFGKIAEGHGDADSDYVKTACEREWQLHGNLVRPVASDCGHVASWLVGRGGQRSRGLELVGERWLSRNRLA